MNMQLPEDETNVLEIFAWKTITTGLSIGGTVVFGSMLLLESGFNKLKSSLKTLFEVPNMEENKIMLNMDTQSKQVTIRQEDYKYSEKCQLCKTRLDIKPPLRLNL